MSQPARRLLVEATPSLTQITKRTAGRPAVRWGIEDGWMPTLEELERQGHFPDLRAGHTPPAVVARWVYDAHRQALPEPMHRTYESLLVGLSPSAKCSTMQLMVEMMDLYEERMHPEPEPQPRLRMVPKAKPKPPEEPPMPTAKADPLAGFLAMPIGSVLPHLKTLLAAALADVVNAALQPHLEQLRQRIEGIEPSVRQALVDVLGEPAPAAAQVTANTTVAAASPVVQDPLPLPPEPADPVLPFPPPTPAPTPQPAPRVTQMLELPVVHDIGEQMESVAKALGMPHVKRPSVVIVGLHPRVMEEVERKHGREYRFVYIKQDHFNEASDLPASTDALLLHRKKLNSFLAGVVRRYAIPNRSIANSLAAVEWGLREIFRD